MHVNLQEARSSLPVAKNTNTQCYHSMRLRCVYGCGVVVRLWLMFIWLLVDELLQRLFIFALDASHSSWVMHKKYMYILFRFCYRVVFMPCFHELTLGIRRGWSSSTLCWPPTPKPPLWDGTGKKTERLFVLNR